MTVVGEPGVYKGASRYAGRRPVGVPSTREIAMAVVRTALEYRRACASAVAPVTEIGLGGQFGLRTAPDFRGQPA